MNDYQIARNLGEMFENATKSLNSVFDTTNISLPPSVTSFINTNYYNVETTFRPEEIIKGLESNNDNEVYTVLKHLVGQLVTRYDNNDNEDNNEDNNETVKEIIQLFPYIVKNVNSNNLKIKRLVYMILLSFNHLQQDISLLSINAIQKSLIDKNAINRSLAIRCLSGIKIPAILPILLLSMGKLVKDSSPLVRSACSIAIIKCAELDIEFNNKNKNKIKNKNKNKNDINNNLNDELKIKREYLIENLKDETSIIYQLSNYLNLLLSDNDPKVLSCAINAYYTIFNGFYDLIHNKIENLINHIEFLDNFSISNLSDIIINYSKLFFEKFETIDKAPIELKELYEHLINLIDYNMNYDVIISIIKCFINLFPFTIKELPIINKILIKLIQRDFYNDINDESKILISLNLIYYLIENELIQFKSYQFYHFLPIINDNINIFNLKILILFRLINKDSFEIIFREVKFLINKSDFNYYFKFKILKQINLLIFNKDLKTEQIDQLIKFFINKLQTETNELLVGEYITGLRQLIQSNLGYYNEILIKLVGRLYESYTTNNNSYKLLDNAKCSIIWLLGEFIINFNNFENNENINILKEFIPELSLILVKNFKKEKEAKVKFEILNFLNKLMISEITEKGKEEIEFQDNQIFKMFNYLLQLSKYDSNLYIRDMSRLIGSIIPNIIYFKEISINQEMNIREILNDSMVLKEHLNEKCLNIELSLLLFQINKPEIFETDRVNNNFQIIKCLNKYLRVTNGELDLGYLPYYRDLRHDGFELKDYTRYTNSISSSSYNNKAKRVETSRNTNVNTHASTNPTHSNSSNKYKLQTLDDFLSGA